MKKMTETEIIKIVKNIHDLDELEKQIQEDLIKKIAKKDILEIKIQ